MNSIDEIFEKVAPTLCGDSETKRELFLTALLMAGNVDGVKAMREAREGLKIAVGDLERIKDDVVR